MNLTEFLAELQNRFPRQADEIMSWRDSYDRILRNLSPSDLALTFRSTLDSWDKPFYPRPTAFAQNKPINPAEKTRGFTDGELYSWKTSQRTMINQTLEHYAAEISAEPSPEFRSSVLFEIERESVKALNAGAAFVDLHKMSPREQISPWQKAQGRAKTREGLRLSSARFENQMLRERARDASRDDRRQRAIVKAEESQAFPQADA